MNVRIYILFTLLLLSFIPDAAAQGLTGKVYNSVNEAVPFVNIYVRELESGTVSDEKGYYFYQLIPGNYNVVYSAVGYETVSKEVKMGDEDLTLDVYLNPSSEQLEEVMIKASRKDPAIKIIQNVIDNKKSHQKQLYSFNSDVYVKAYEDKKDSKVRSTSASTEADDESVTFTFGNSDADTDSIPELNLLEMELRLDYLYPDLYKEERTAINKYGDQSGLFVPVFGETDFDIYDNMISLKGISDIPLISPISNTAILSYKYKLESTELEEGRLVYKIKVIPRKKGNATCSGYIYVNDSTWNVNRFDLDIYKGALKFYDAFNLNIAYDEIEPNVWLPLRREFLYKTKVGRFKSFDGQTLIIFSNFKKDVEFPEKYFGNELALTTREAYDKDSSYWNLKRPEPLTIQQVDAVAYRDSVEAVLDSPEYKDSIEQAVNKIELLDIVWEGLEFQNWRKKQGLFINPIPAMWSYNIVGGFRLGQSVNYNRRFEDERRLQILTRLNVGLNRKDVTGRIGARYVYDPYHLGRVSASFGRHYRPVNPFDAILSQLNPYNWVKSDFYEIEHRRELFNGFYVEVGLNYGVLRSINEGFELTPLDSFLIDLNAYEAGEPLDFEDYSTFSTDIILDYTPGQRYMSEPNRKIVLGSKWPTFTLRYKKGWKNVIGSITDYDYLGVAIRQNIIFGPLGNSKYNIKTGKFLNTKELPFIDVKRFRRSDPWLYHSPLNAFQLLDTTLATENLFLEFHHIHHFNGALINNIPLVKKLGIGAVVGGGFLWAQDADFNHSELFAGLERTFKLGPRRRLRLGVYGLTAKSTEKQLDSKVKFSIDVIDTWKKDWSF